MKTPDPFLAADAIRAATFARHVEIHDTLGSTNDRARVLSQVEDLKLPAVVVARRQTSGRGRGQHSWWAADGALTFSILLSTSTVGIQPAKWPQLSLATAVAVCDALEPHAVQRAQPSSHPALLQIKWPNDVLIEGRKVCGILIESPGGVAPAKDRLIVGVGININNSLQHAPSELRETASALCDVIGAPLDLQQAFVDILNRFWQRIEELRHDDPKLTCAWQERDFFAGKRIAVDQEARSIEGRCAAIARDGALQIETTEGVQRIYSGSARLV